MAVLPTVEHHCTASSVNRKLAAVSTFYEFHARSGIEVADLLVTMRPAGRHRSAATSYKPYVRATASSSLSPPWTSLALPALTFSPGSTPPGG
ncbi:hypothetical protein ABCR94_18625 [Streptomyces sp. 21So2-11]|uniref:hypothetical protein n=1 Tax=Streptomyces sp. 21So2-11 TaxID=3144408 RepID=UPI00321B8BB2